MTLGQCCCSGQSSASWDNINLSTVPSTCHNHYKIQICNRASATTQQNNLEDKSSSGIQKDAFRIIMEEIWSKYWQARTFYSVKTSMWWRILPDWLQCQVRTSQALLNVTNDVGENVEKSQFGLKKPSFVLLFPHCAHSPRTNLWWRFSFLYVTCYSQSVCHSVLCSLSVNSTHIW